MRQPETFIKDAICDYLSAKNVCFWTVNNSAPYSKRLRRYLKPYKYHLDGVADICGIWKGRALFIECKTKTGKQSVSQREFERRVKKEKGRYILARSLDDVKDII